MTSFYGLRASFYTNGNKQQIEERVAIPASGSLPLRPHGTFAVTLAAAVLETPLAGLYLDKPGQPGTHVIQALRGPSGEVGIPVSDDTSHEEIERLAEESRQKWGNIGGMVPLYVQGAWDEAPEPYAEVRELGTLFWFPEGAFLVVSCAMLPREEQAPAGRSLPVASWGAPRGMAAWAFKAIQRIARVYMAPRAGDPKGYTPIMDAALASIDRNVDAQWHERVKRAAAWSLAKEMHKVLTDWRAGGLEEQDACLERDGMLALDAAFCELLRGFGPEGSTLAEALRQQRRERRRTQGESWRGWELWLTLDEKWGDLWNAPWSFPFLRYLADVLWLDRVAAAFEVERECIEREGSHRPALARGLVHDGLLPILSRRVEVRDAQIIDRDGGAVVAHLAPSINAALALSLAQPGALDVFGRVHAHRLINHLVRTVHEQKEAGVTDFRALDFEGGFSGLREVIGYTLSKNDELEHLLNAGAGLQFVVPDGQGAGLWTWRSTRAARGRKASLRIVTGDPLLPNFNEVYKGTTFEPRLSRRLIPVLDHEPRLDLLNSRHQGPALTLVLLMLVELRDNAGELATNGAIRTTAARWRDLAARAGLPAGLVNDVLEAWSSPNSGAVQLIERSGAEWTLAEPHALARDFIIEGGQRELIGGQNGRRAKKAKQAKTR